MIDRHQSQLERGTSKKLVGGSGNPALAGWKKLFTEQRGHWIAETLLG